MGSLKLHEHISPNAMAAFAPPPTLPGPQCDALKEIEVYVQYFRSSRDFGSEALLELELSDRQTVIETLVEQHQQCARMQQPWAKIIRGIINDTLTHFDSYEAANSPIREIVGSDAHVGGTFQEKMELDIGEGTDANAETGLGVANSPAMSDNALEDSEDNHDAPLRALALYDVPAGVTLEDPCAYPENREMESSSTGSLLNWWCKIALVTPPLIDIFKKINALEFTKLEKEKILKWGVMSKSHCQILRN